jgi:hypothetical protein
MPLSPLIKKSFDAWINSDTWCQGHACDKARFYTFVWNVVRYSRKRLSEKNLKALILERWDDKWDSEYLEKNASFYSSLYTSLLEFAKARTQRRWFLPSEFEETHAAL